MKKLFAAFLLVVVIMPLQALASEITVSAAASLANAFTELQKLFEAKHPGTVVHMNFAASNPLLRQIVEGAPVDVFASADQATMDKAQEAGVIDPQSRRDFAVNDLVLIVPKDCMAPDSPAALKKMRHIAIGDPDSVPAGRYARAALQNAGLWDKLQPHFVYGSSVRQVLDYTARGEADAGIVYGTDARQMADKVQTALTLTGHPAILYPIAVATTGQNAAQGKEFTDFVHSPEGQAVLAKYGFGRPMAK